MEKKHTPQHIKDLMIQLEIDHLLDDDDERPEPLDPYDLAGPSINLEEDTRFINGVKKMPDAYKKEKPAYKPTKPAYKELKPADKPMPPATHPPLKVPKRTKDSINESYLLEIMTDKNGSITLGPIMTATAPYWICESDDGIIKLDVASIRQKIRRGQFVTKLLDIPGGSTLMAELKYDMPQLLMEQ
jgi:hypothetical protein